MPPLGDRRPLALFAEMQSLLPRDANILFNAIFLCRLPERIRLALVDKGEILPGDLALAADLLQHSDVTLAASITLAPPIASPAPVNMVYTPPRRQQSRSPPQRRCPISPRRPFPTPHRSRPPLPWPPSGSTLCFYHYNFDRLARRCQPPCSWQGNE